MKESRRDRAARPRGDLARARSAYRQRDWEGAYLAFAAAAPLGAEDLEPWAQSAYLTAREDQCLELLERAHHAQASGGERPGAARSAFWLGLTLLFRQQIGPAMGWFARAQRILADHPDECAERGLLLLPGVERHLDAGEHEAALAAAAEAVAIGERVRDRDLIACARHLLGRVHLAQGHTQAGLTLLDETMISVTGGELSPRVTGMIYCSVIQACQLVYAFDRSRQWTAALARWCDSQPTLMAFTGPCMLHRAEIMQLSGAWTAAIDEAVRASERLTDGHSQSTQGAALYQQGEIHRLRGAFPAAETAYERAGQLGRDPQPGLALLRLAQGSTDLAVAAITRALGATVDTPGRTRFLPAAVEVHLAAGDLETATSCCEELGDTATKLGTEALKAMAAHALGSVEVAAGRPSAALVPLRAASTTWQRLRAPYADARARVQLGRACRALGDQDGASLEHEAARVMFEQLGARPELAELDAQGSEASTGKATLPGGITLRELEVLRLVATGKSSKRIAAELGLSVKTIDRHLSNIFTKLDLSSRAEATAFAFKHHLI